MKTIDVSMFELSISEAKMLSDGVPVLIYDTWFKNNFKIIKSSEKAPYFSEDFDTNRYVLLLFDVPIYKTKR